MCVCIVDYSNYDEQAEVASAKHTHRDRFAEFEHRCAVRREADAGGLGVAPAPVGQDARPTSGVDQRE